MSRKSRRSGFTLVELLVVAGAVSVMGTQLIQAITEAREAARRSQCKNNLKQIALSLHNYHDTYNGLPPGWIGVDSETEKANVMGLNGWAWGARLLPFMDQAPLYNTLNFSASVTDPKHAQIVNKTFPTLRCPSDPFTKKVVKLKDAKGEAVAEVGPSNYPGSFGTGNLAKCEKMKPGETCTGDGIFEHNTTIKFGDIKDGLSNTLAVGERTIDEKTDRVTTWSGVFPKAKSPFSRILATSEQELNAKEKSVYGYASPHTGGAHFMIMDGVVRFIKSDLDLKVFQALTTRAGGEEITNDF